MVQMHITSAVPAPYPWPDEIARGIRIGVILLTLTSWFMVVAILAAAGTLRTALLNPR